MSCFEEVNNTTIKFEFRDQIFSFVNKLKQKKKYAEY